MDEEERLAWVRALYEAYNSVPVDSEDERFLYDWWLEINR